MTNELEQQGELALALSEAVDEEFYRFLYGDPPSGMTAAEHYAAIGWREGHDPNTWFSTRAYLATHEDVAAAGVVPLFHYLERGSTEGRAIEPSTSASIYHARGATPQAANEAGREGVDDDDALALETRIVAEHFDRAYYLEANPDVRDLGTDPVAHFVRQGWREGRNPTQWFSTKTYLVLHADVERAGIDPFFHFLTQGRFEGRLLAPDTSGFDVDYYRSNNPDVARAGIDLLKHFIERGWLEGRAPNAAGEAALLERRVRESDGPVDSNYEYVLGAMKEVGTVSIVIPIYDAFDKLEICLDALFRNTTYPAEVILVDDASPDRNGAAMLDRYRKLPNVRVLSNETNLGFSGAVNRGLEASTGDVVVLNSDTSVGPRWLENMVFAACQRPRIGTVTAISNRAGVFSVLPEGSALWNIRPEQRDAISRLAMQNSKRYYPATPTANAFCMFVRRRMLDEVGLFDSSAFPEGYGEENDFCMRALKLGWEHVIDDATLVFHAESGSFGDERRHALSTVGAATVAGFHADYVGHAKRLIDGPRLAAVKRWGGGLPVGTILNGERTVAPRMVHIVQGSSSDRTLDFCLDLIAGTSAYECYLLTSTGTRLVLHAVQGGTLTTVASNDYFERSMVTDIYNPEYRRAVYELLGSYGFELAHVHNVVDHGLDLFEVLGLLRIPAILTLHDYYFACPNATLLDDGFTFCDGTCTPGEGSCRHESPWLASAPPLKHAFVHEWRRRVAKALAHVGACAFPSQDARLRSLRTTPMVSEKPSYVIERGVDFPRVQAAEAPTPGGKIRIVVPRCAGPEDGSNVVEALHARDEEGRLEFHVFGPTTGAIERFAIAHAEREGRAIVERIAAIKPAFGGDFSIWATTDCYAILHSWSAGVPALGSRLGAAGARIRQTGAGWTFDVNDTEALYAGILAIAGDAGEYRRGVSATQDVAISSPRDMAGAYCEAYENARRGTPTQASS